MNKNNESPCMAKDRVRKERNPGGNGRKLGGERNNTKGGRDESQGGVGEKERERV